MSVTFHALQWGGEVGGLRTSHKTCGRYRAFATRVSQLKICDFSGETFKGFEVL